MKEGAEFWRVYWQKLFFCAIIMSGLGAFDLLRKLWHGTLEISVPWGHMATVFMGLVGGCLLLFFAFATEMLVNRKTVRALFVLFYLSIGILWAYSLTGSIVGAPGFIPLSDYVGAHGIRLIALIVIVAFVATRWELWARRKRREDRRGNSLQ